MKPALKRRAAAAALVLVAVALAAAAAASRSEDRISGPSIAFLRIAIGSDADPAENAGRYAYVITQAWRAEAVPAVREAGARALVYKNLSFVDCGDHAEDEAIPSGVRCTEARERGWLAEDASGDEVVSDGYPWLALADVADRGYLERWVENVVAEARERSWDGVAIDDVNSTLRYHLDTEELPEQLQDEAWREAMGEALEVVGAALRREGLTVVANICCRQHHEEVWREWLPDISGWTLEHFVKSGADPASGAVPEEEWRRQLDAAGETQARGKVFFGVTTSSPDDEAAATYGLSTLLLTTRGRAVFALQDGENSQEIWFDVYERARALGKPTDDSESVDGAYRRRFENGAVHVNPTDSPVTVDGVTLEPWSGRIDAR